MQLSPYAEQYPNATTVPICRTISKCNCTHMPRNIQMQLSPYAEEYPNATVPICRRIFKCNCPSVHICRRISKCNCSYMPKNILMQLSIYAEEYPNATVPICRRISKCSCPYMQLPRQLHFITDKLIESTNVSIKKHIEHMWKEECQFFNMQKAERNNSCPITSNSDSPENVQTCGIYI